MGEEMTDAQATTPCPPGNYGEYPTAEIGEIARGGENDAG